MKTKPTTAQNRRYKLHQVIKGFVLIKAKQKTVLTHPKELEQLLPKQAKAVDELRDRFFIIFN